MAVSRGGIAFWVGCVRGHGRRRPITKQNRTPNQAIDLQWLCETRPLSSASWALVPPNSLRYQSIKQPVLSHPFHHASQPQRASGAEEDWDEPLAMCVVLRRRWRSESGPPHTLLEIPLSGQTKLGELLSPGPHRSAELLFPLTTVDGSGLDDISVRSLRRSGGGGEDDPLRREHGCFRSLFQAESCPAPFMYGSHFYCFHCPGTEPRSGAGGVKPRAAGRLESKPVDLRLMPAPPPPRAVALCGHMDGADVGRSDRDREGEEKLALLYEKLRIELPNLFLRSHDYSMYSDDLEFINGILHIKTRGRTLYQLTLSAWRMVCLCYFADAQLEVLKLTKHMEDGTIKARWRLRGLPLHSFILRFYRKDKSQLYRSYDAFSTFYMGHDGLIHCHKIEKMMPVQPPLLPRVGSLLAGALVALGIQEHRPVLNLLPLLLSSLRQVRD